MGGLDYMHGGGKVYDGGRFLVMERATGWLLEQSLAV